MDEADFARLDRALARLADALAPAARATTARELARLARRQHVVRIAAQQDPDGQAFAARKERKAAPAGDGVRAFLYPAPGGRVRKVVLTGWIREGGLISGFSPDHGGQRSFAVDKVLRWLPADAGRDAARAAPARPKRRRKPRGQPMFKKLVRSQLRARGDASGAEVGFAGVAASIAEIHQEGLMDRARPGAPLTRYARRTLLGLSERDRDQVLDLLASRLFGP